MDVVRPEAASMYTVALDGSAIYFIRYLMNVNDSPDHEIYVARPENGPAQLLARISGARASRIGRLSNRWSHLMGSGWPMPPGGSSMFWNC